MSRITKYGIFIAIIAGFFIPYNKNLSNLIPILLTVIMFFSFLKINFNLKQLFRKELLFYFIISVLILPVIVFFLTINLETNLRIGLFLVAITPTAISAPIVVDLIKGNRELITSNVILFNLLSPITYTLMIKLFFNKSDLVIDISKLFWRLTFIIVIPLILASLVKKLGHDENLIKISKHINPYAFLLVVGVAVSSASSKIKLLNSGDIIRVILIVAVMAVVSFTIGFLVARGDKNKKAMTVAFGHRNSALTTWIAISNFAPITVIPIVIYIVCHHIINGFLLNKFS